MLLASHLLCSPRGDRASDSVAPVEPTSLVDSCALQNQSRKTCLLPRPGGARTATAPRSQGGRLGDSTY